MSSMPNLQPGDGAVSEVNGETLAMYNDGGHVRCASATCTHLGCTVEWNGDEKTFDCPCHGSRYNNDFSVKQGPAKRPLDPREPQA